MHKEAMIKVLKFSPGAQSRELVISNDLPGLKGAIGGGWLECVPLHDGLVLICDEEGKLKGQAPNERYLIAHPRGNTVTPFPPPGALFDVLVGHCFICRSAGEEFASLTEADLAMMKGV
jgi:hypothetical protein